MNTAIFRGCIPALLTPCNRDRTPNYPSLVRKGKELLAAGMNAVVYCGSMGDWPLLSDPQRQEGVRRLVEAGVPVIVGTGAQNTAQAVSHAAHAQDIGAQGLMVIPRVLSRGTSAVAQRDHFGRVLGAALDLPAVIYNSPYYGFETKADLFFNLRCNFPNLVGFKEFGGQEALSYAAEFITHSSDNLLLMAGVDTQVVHGFLRCGAKGAITGIGNCLPEEVLLLVSLCKLAASGDVQAGRLASELSDAIAVLSRFDEGPDLVLYYKYLLVLLGDSDYELHFNESDELTPSQKLYAESQLTLFQSWWNRWPGKFYSATKEPLCNDPQGINSASQAECAS